MMDLERMIEVVRIYYRNETNFAYGHADIELKSFLSPVTSIHFLSYEDNESLFVKNAFKGQLYSINDVELIIDTKTFKEKYQKVINDTYVLNITAFNAEKPENKVSSSFRLTFASRYDMNSYYIGNSEIYHYGYSYGDPSFSKIVSDFYYGPDLKFDLSIKSISDGAELVIPNITSTQDQSNLRELDTQKDCNNSFFNRFTNRKSGVENIAFYCVFENEIEQHIFDTRDLIEIRRNVKKYNRYRFIDFFVVMVEDEDERKTGDKLIVLSEEAYRSGKRYFMHYFDIKRDLITWHKKTMINIKNYKLREQDPLINFDQGKYLVFIDSYETTLFFISESGEEKHNCTLKSRVKNLDVFNDYLYVTYYESKYISVLKVSRVTEEGREYLTTELLNDYKFDHKVIEFDTKDSKQTVIFSQENTIELWEIITPYRIDFVRKLPFYRYFEKMIFYINEDEKKLVYARFDRFLYVIMVNKEDQTDKKLFCFNIFKTSHDALYSVIYLDSEVAHLSNKIFIESNRYVSTIFIYLFYGTKTYQFIKFEPENLLQQTNSDSGELFLPSNYQIMNKYPSRDVVLTINPHYDEYIPSQNKTIDLVIHCHNYGLKIESLTTENKFSYHNKEGESILSLLDYFDGFNNTFKLDYYNTESQKVLEYYFSKDTLQKYLLEEVNNEQKVLFSMEYDDYVLFFYEQDYLLQLYDVRDEIRKVDKKFYYNSSDLFDGCSIEYIQYTHIQATNDTFFVVNCRNFTGKISPAYQYKIFHIKEVSETNVVIEPILVGLYSEKIQDAHMSKCHKHENMYSLVMITESEVPSDTYLLVTIFACPTFQS